MKRIIELPDDVVKAIYNGEDYRYDIHTAIAQSKPYEERPKGEWIETGYETGALGITYRQTQCSNCGWEHALPMWWNFCPNCGADMRKAV